MLEFFLAEELEPYVESKLPNNGSSSSNSNSEDLAVINMTNANLGWITEEQAATQAVANVRQQVKDMAKEKSKSLAAAAAAPPSTASAFGSGAGAGRVASKQQGNAKHAEYEMVGMKSEAAHQPKKTNLTIEIPSSSDDDLQAAQEGVEHPEEAAKVNRSIHTLTNMNFSVQKGQLVAVVGSVGSGTCWLLIALNRIPIESNDFFCFHFLLFVF